MTEPGDVSGLLEVHHSSLEHTLKRFLPSRVKHALQVGALAFVMGAGQGGQPVPNASPDSGSFVPIPTQTTNLEPTSTPTLEPTPISTVKPTPEPTPSPSPTPESQSLIFTNNPDHFWIPALGINAPVGVLDCGGPLGGSLPNATDIFSSGCAGGSDNLFFMGHDYGVFKPINEAYHSGRLQALLKSKAGLLAYYTDGIGELHAYKLLWVQHPTVKDFGKGSSWAATPTPVITLDTCDAGEAYRILARFVPTRIPSALPTAIQSQIPPTK